jgi:glucose-1-phosphatase
VAIRAVGFDYLGVIAFLRGRSVFEVVAEICTTDKESVYTAYRHHNAKLQSGELTVDQLWQKVLDELGRPELLDSVLSVAAEDAPQIDPAMIGLVDELRKKGYKVGLLSNLSAGWAQAFHSQKADEHFDAVVLSSEAGYSKPDSRAFQELAKRLSAETDELVFIDDRSEYLVAVEDIGVTPIVFEDIDQLRKRLVELKIL